MKRFFALLLVISFVFAMTIPFATPANAIDSVDDVILMSFPYEERVYNVPANDLTQIYQLYIPVEGTYIIQTFGADFWDIDNIVLMDSYGNVIKAQSSYNGYGYYNMLLSCYLTTGYYYLNVGYGCEQCARISITYAKENYTPAYDSYYRTYLADFDNIYSEDMDNLTFYFSSYDCEYAKVALTGCSYYEAGSYVVYVEGWDTAVAYIIDPTSVLQWDAAMATADSPAPMVMQADRPYYVVVYLGDLYGSGYGTTVDYAVVTIRFERV